MNNSLSEDYFSFMSKKRDKVTTAPAARRSQSADPAVDSIRPSDTIDFVEESQIEVVESIVSDTMIQRIFKRFAATG